MDKDKLDKHTNRRDFIKTASAITLGGLGLAACEDEKQPVEDREAPGASRILSYRELGNTGLKASDISFGAGGLSNYRVALNAIDMGINYFDTAPDYGAGRSENTLGKAIKAMKQSRDKVIIATKMCHLGGYPSHMYNESTATYIKGVEDSLKRLQTDYIDFLFVHALGEKDTGSTEIARLKDEKMLEAVSRLKKQGKIRHLAVSCHNYKAGLDGGIDYAIDSGHYGLVMLAYSFKGHRADKENLNKVINISKKAKEKGVAFVAMKTLKGAKGVDPSLLRGKGTFAQASFKWVLDNPAVSCLVVTMRNMTDINEYVKASGKKFGQTDHEVLMKAAMADDNCQIGCTSCEPACDKGVKISDILRYNMYFTNYDQQKHAMEKYSYLPASNRADACGSCDAACEKACPYGVSVKEKLAEAHSNLVLA
ncbi:MAG: aldo/keto reductase [Spirochaetota bacterium]|nr:aldo/keto reductase [Spirochaetota bacterium]